MYDLATAHILALHHLEDNKGSGCFNIGNNIGTSVLEIIDAVKRVTGRDFEVIYAERRSGDPAKLVGSSEKAKRVLGWKPIYEDIDIIVRHALAWHEKAVY